MKQLKVSLPDDLRARLDAASAKSGRSVGEEIRGRIEATFTQEAVDKSTRELAENVARLAAEIERERGAAWHKHAGAHEVLALAIQLWLEPLKPKGPTAFGDRPHATTSEDDPHKLAALIVHRIRNNPNFTSSPTRKWMEEEHQSAKLNKALAERAAERRRQGLPVSWINEPWINEPPQQDKKDNEQRKPDQQRKKGKKS
jgi:plasmid stability protein